MSISDDIRTASATGHPMDPDAALFSVKIMFPDNKVCFDCTAKDPTCVSFPNGVFICERCSNHHNELGFAVGNFRDGNFHSWTPKQLRMMTFGGNDCASLCLDKFVSTGEKNLEAKYTSRQAVLLREMLLENVQESFAEDTEALKAYNLLKGENPDISVDKPLGATMSRMVIGYCLSELAPQTSNTLKESVMENRIWTRSFSTSNQQIKETYEARRRFPNEKSISSAQFFGDQEKMNDTEAKLHLQNFPVCEIKETDETRRKFPNAKSISSAHFFGDQEKMNDTEAKLRLQKFANSIAISSADFFNCEMNNHPPMLSGEDFVDRLSSQNSIATSWADLFGYRVNNLINWVKSFFNGLPNQKQNDIMRDC